MAASETARDGGGGMLAGLLASLRLPERVIDTLDSLAEGARELGPMRSELTRVREQTEPLAELIPALERLIKQTEPLSELMAALESLKKDLGEQLERLQELIIALEGDESHLNLTARELVDELVAMHKTVTGSPGYKTTSRASPNDCPTPARARSRRRTMSSPAVRQPKLVAHTRSAADRLPRNRAVSRRFGDGR